MKHVWGYRWEVRYRDQFAVKETQLLKHIGFGTIATASIQDYPPATASSTKNRNVALDNGDLHRILQARYWLAPAKSWHATNIIYLWLMLNFKLIL